MTERGAFDLLVILESGILSRIGSQGRDSSYPL